MRQHPIAKIGATPSATDVVTTNGLVFVNPKVKTTEYSDVGNGAMGAKKTAIDPNYITAEFDIPVQIKKASALGVAPSLSSLWKMCGLSETITASTKVEYKLGGTSNLGQGQIKSFTDGYSRTVTGIAATAKISGKIGDPLGATFSIKGFLTAAAPVAEANPTVTLDTLQAPLVSKVTVLTSGGSTLNADSFELDIGNDIGDIYAVGQSEFYLKDFDPSLTVTAVKVAGTDDAAWTDFLAGTVRAIVIQVGSAGGMIEITAPNAFLKEVSEADESGYVKITRTFRLQASAGNDNFQITYK